jgi:DNA invertase Pin-like site-specific DNA recombinase
LSDPGGAAPTDDATLPITAAMLARGSKFEWHAISARTKAALQAAEVRSLALGNQKNLAEAARLGMVRMHQCRVC